MYRPKLKPLTISMIAFGLFLVMRTTIARYVLVEIPDDVVGELAGRAGISTQLRNRSIF